MKKIEITFGFLCSFMLTILMFGMSLSLFAQEESPTVTKQKIIVKKIIDEDGNETTETTETEVEVNVESIENMDGDYDIDVDETVENGVRKKVIKIRIDSENGELPQDILDELEALGINLNIEGSGEETIIIGTDDGEEGEQDIQMFKFKKGEAIPEDVQKLLEEQGIDLDEIKKGEEHGIRMIKRFDDLDEEVDMLKLVNSGKSGTIDRQTKIFRIASIDDLDEDLIKEIEDMGVTESELRTRFDDAENSLRIYKEGLQPVTVESDNKMAEAQVFFMPEEGEMIEVEDDIDMIWIDKEQLDEFQNEVEKLKLDSRKLTNEKRPFLGINMENTESGVRVLKVVKDAPAEKAGLQAGDVIKTINGNPVANTDDLVIQIAQLKIGDVVSVGYIREGQNRTANATLGEREMPILGMQDFDFEMPEMPRIPRIATERGHLGVTLNNDATIEHVKPESAAANAGLEVGDQLLKIGEISVSTADDVVHAMTRALPGTNTDVTFKRDGTEQTVTLVPGMPTRKRHHRHRHHQTCSPDDKARWMKHTKADCEKRCSTPFLGIYMEERDRDVDSYDVEITGIVQNTGAEAAGILQGDILRKINRTRVSSVKDVVDIISEYEPGDVIRVQVLRDGKKKRIKATLSNQTQDDVFSPCDCATGEINTNAMTTKEIIIIKENSEADIPDMGIDTNRELELDDIDLFPNPNNGTFTVRFSTWSKALTTISIIDVSGKEVYRENIKDFNGRYDNQIDISTAPKGTYFLNIIQGEKVFTEQFVFGND